MRKLSYSKKSKYYKKQKLDSLDLFNGYVKTRYATEIELQDLKEITATLKKTKTKISQTESGKFVQGMDGKENKLNKHSSI